MLHQYSFVAELPLVALPSDIVCCVYYSCRYLAFLESAASYAREHWTQFNHVSMVAGLLFFACSLSAQTASVFVPNKPVSGVIDKVRKNGVEFLNILRRWPAACLTVPVWFVLLISAHVMGIFSFFFLLSEGKDMVSTV